MSSRRESEFVRLEQLLREADERAEQEHIWKLSVGVFGRLIACILIESHIAAPALDDFRSPIL
jgi:hypothetical protein